MQSRSFPSTAEALAFPSANQASLSWVQFETSGGSSVSLQIITPGGKITKPADPVRTGYTLSGWYLDAALTAAWDFNQIVSSDNLTLYAKWTAITYTIAYTLNGGSGGNTPASYTIETADITLGTPTRTGYTFGGWFTDSAFSGSAVTAIAKGSTGNKTFYAAWTPITYTVAYVFNGGSDPGNAATFTIESPPIPLTASTRRGYDFAGWFDNAGFLGIPVTSIPAGSIEDRTYYAKWTVIVYTISWTLNGGSLSPANPATYTVESPDIIFNNPTRRGYEFLAWYDNSDFLGAPEAMIHAGSVGNRTYYADWQLLVYQITYGLGGGTNNHGNPAEYTVESSTIPLQDAERRGYAFRGWYGSPDFSGSPVITIPHGSITDRFLWAKWEIIVYPIEYVVSGGSNSPDNPAGYTVADKVILYNPERPGFGFAGWFDNAGFLDAPIGSIPAGTIGVLKFFARWVKGVSFPSGRNHVDRFSGDPKIFIGG